MELREHDEREHQLDEGRDHRDLLHGAHVAEERDQRNDTDERHDDEERQQVIHQRCSQPVAKPP